MGRGEDVIRSFGIVAKIYLIVALVAVVAGSVSLIGMSALGTFMTGAEDMRDAVRLGRGQGAPAACEIGAMARVAAIEAMTRS